MRDGNLKKEVNFMKKIIVGCSVTLSLLLIVTIALASGSKFDRKVGAGSESNYSLSDIPDLTPEQFSHIQALRQALLKEIEPLQRDRAAKEVELQALEAIPDADQTVIIAKEKEIFQIERRLHEEIVNATIEVRRLLTPGQNARLPDFSSGVIGERGFNPIMCKMWGLAG
jgi:Spy/CpxP family protein refolding chaperone